MSTKIDRTIERLETALMIRPDDRHQRVQLGRAYQQARRYADAEEAYQIVLRVEPNSAEALYSLGLLRQEQDRASEALTLYQRAVAADGEHIGARRVLAEHAVELRDFSRAREHYEQLVRLQPNESKFLRSYASVLMQLSQNELAAEVLERALRLDPNDLESVVELCACWSVLGEWQKITNLALPFVNNPQLPLVVLDQLGHATRQLRSLEEAQAVFRERLTREATTSARSGLAWVLLQQGRYSEVIKELEKISESNLEVHSLRGQAFFHLRKWTEAQAALLPAAELAPGDGDVHHWLGLTLLELGKLDEAVRHLRHAVRYLPASVESWVGLASALVRLEQWDSAVEPMQRAIELEPHEPAHHARLGGLQARLGRSDLAESCYSKAVELESSNGEYWFGLAETRVRLEQFSAAERDLDRATQLLPSNAQVLASLGLVRMKLGRLQDAIAPLEQAIHLEPTQLQSRLNLTRAFVGLGRFAESLKVLEGVDAAQNESPVVLELLGQTLFELRRFEDASAVLTRRTALPNVPADAWVWLGLALEQISRYTEAEAALIRAVELDGVAVLGLSGLGRCRLQLGRPSDAIEPLERWARITPKEVDGWRLLGQAHGAIGEQREARDYLERALALAPDDGLTLEQYGLTLAALGDDEGAIEQLRKACSVLPRAQAAWRGIAELEDKMGRLPAAIEAWRKVLTMSPQDRGALGNLAGLYHRAGEATEALATWRRVLQNNGDDVEALVGASRSLAALNRDPESAQVLRQLLRLDPERHQEALALGQCLMRLGQNEEALTWLRRANDKQPTADCWEHIATCLERLKQPADEFEALSTCLTFDDGRGPLWRRLGFLALQLGYRPRAIEALERAWSLGVGDTLLQEKLGEALRETARDARSDGALEMALSALERAERFQSNDASLFAEQSEIATALERSEVAIERIRRANILAPDDSGYLLRLASLLLDEGELDAALAQFRKATQLAPAHFDAWVGLGKTLAGLGQIRPAIDAYRQALSLRDTATQERAVMGIWMAEEGLCREAVPELERVLKEEPRQVNAARWLARCLTKLGQLEPTTRAWRSVLRGEAADVEALFGLGKASWDLQKPQDARFPLEQLHEQIESGELSEPPRGFWEVWARVLHALGEDQGAEIALQRAASEASNRDTAADLGALRASSLVRLERFAEALSEVDQLLSSSPSDVNLLQLRARALAGVGQADAAVGALKRILASKDSTLEDRRVAAGKLSELYREQLSSSLSAREPRRSEETLTELLELVREWGFHGFTAQQAGAWYARVVELFRECGQVEPAKAAVDAAIAQFPEDASLYILRGQLFEESKAWEHARETYAQAAAIEKSVAASLGEGRVLGKLGRWLEAKATLEQALRFGAELAAPPSAFAELHEQLLAVGQTLGDHPLIVKHAEQLGGLRALRVNEWRLLGFALDGVGRFADAVEAFQAVLDEQPEDGDVRYAMAMALHQGQRSRAAIVPLRQLVQQEPTRAEAWRELGKRLVEASDHAAACECYERAASLIADSHEVAREWVDAAVASGKAPELERALSHACVVVGDATLKVQWASVLEELGDTTRAAEVLSALLEGPLAPQLATTVSHRLAALELRRGRALVDQEPEQARWVLLRAGEHAVGEHATLMAVVRALVELGASAPAIQLCDKGLEAKPEDTELALFLGGVATQRGEHARAADAYERVARLQPDQVYPLLAAGRARLAANQPTVAEGWLKRAAHLDPSHGEVAALLERVTSALGQTEGTLRAQEAMLQVTPDDAGLHERYIRLLAAEGLHDRVAAAVRRAEAQVGPIPALLALGASSLQASGRYAEAVIWAERALEASPTDAHALRALGASQIELGELERGVDSLLQARVAEPSLALGEVLSLGLVGRGRVRAERGDFQAAALDFEQALKEGAEPLVVLPSLANAARRAKQLARALGAARDLAEMQPNAGNLCMVGELCLELAQPREAAIAFEAAVNLEPSGAGYLGLGTAYCRLGDERAKTALRRAMELRPGSDGYELLAQWHVKAGEWAAGAEALESLAKHRPLTEAEAIQLARAHEKSGDMAKAASAWRRVAEQTPTHEEARWESGRLQLALGDAEGAVRMLEQLLSINPHHPQANAALGRALAQLGRAEDALKALERQVQRSPEPELLRLIAQQQQQLGQDSGSITALERAVQLEPSNVQAWLELAPQLVKAGRHSEAVAAARRAVGLKPDNESRRVLADVLAHFADFTASRAERASCRAALVECAELVGATSSSLGIVLNVSLAVSEADIAVQVAGKLIQAEPDDARLHRALGRAHLMRGEWAEAAAALEAGANLVLRHQHRPGLALPASVAVDGAPQLLMEWSRALQQGDQLMPAAQTADRALRMGAASDEHRRYAATIHQQAAEDLLGQGFADRALPLLERASELTERPAEVAFLTALAQRLSGQTERAIEAARDCLQFDPRHRAAFRLGKELLTDHADDAALRGWYEEHTTARQEPDVAFDYATLLVRDHDHEPARRILWPLLENGTWSERVAHLLADSFRATEEWEHEVDVLTRSSKRKRLGRDYLRRLAESLEKLGRLDEAALALEDVLREEEDDAEQLVKLAGLQLEVKRHEEALSCVDRALAKQPRHLVALRMKAWILKQMDRPAERIPVLQLVTRQDPQAKELEELADLCLGVKRHEDAEHALAEWARLYPRDARAHLRCGLVRAQWGDASLASESLERALQLDDSLDVARARLGELYQRRIQRHLADGEYNAALVQSERWVRVDPKQPDAHHSRAECLQALGRGLEAVAGWRLVLTEHPGHAPSAQMFAAQLAGTGRFDEAELVLAKAVGANRDSLALMSTLAQLYVTQRKFEQAEIVAKRALGLGPDDVDVLILLSQICGNTSRSKEAEEYARRALRVNPNHSEANYTLGKLYLALGRLDLAQTQLDKLVRINSPRAEKLASRLARAK